MTLLTSWPTVTDDLGDRITGTVWGAALHASSKSAIEALVHSTTNPTVSPANAIDELVAARGSLASLDARLDVSLNDDGTPKPVAGAAVLTDLQGIMGQASWLYNGDFLIWPAGDAAAPAGYTLTGASAAVARCGTGLGDTLTKLGPYSAKVTRAAADAVLYQYLMNATSFAAAGSYFKSLEFAFGAWVYCSVGSLARVTFYDGITSTSSAYHPGTGAWVWCGGVHTVSASATQLRVDLEVKNSSGDAYFSGASALPSPIALTGWIPCPKVLGAIVWRKSGTAGISTAIDKFLPARPLLVRRVQLLALTGPVGAALVGDVNVWDGAAFQSMFSTNPQIADGATGGSQVPDGTYRYRCINGATGATYTNALLDWDIDSVGSGTAGADVICAVQALQYARPQESLLDIADF